jgi:hypothetical protein
MKYLQRIKDFFKSNTPKIFKKSIDEIEEKRNFKDIIYTYNIETKEINKSNIRLPYEPWNGNELNIKLAQKNIVLLKRLSQVTFPQKQLYSDINQKNA